MVNLSQILTVDKTELVEYMGKLSGVSTSAVCTGLHLLTDGFSGHPVGAGFVSGRRACSPAQLSKPPQTDQADS